MITLRTLGPVDVSVADRAAPAELLWRKNLALLVYLARSPRRTRSREHLVGLLWGDKPETAARHSLREAIRILRQAAGEGGVETEGDQIRLSQDAVTMDVEQLAALSAQQNWAAAEPLVVGEFLEGFSVPDAPLFEDWLAAERLAVRRLAVDALVHRAAERQRTGDLTGSGECARRALALDAGSDAALRALVSALALRGERAAALEAWDAFTGRQRELLGVEPTDDARRLIEQVRRERAWRIADVRPSGAASRRAPLVGRDRELAALLDAWRDCRNGRATLLLAEGPGGAGRTRLADELVARARLDGAAAAQVRATPADRTEAWAGTLALARGGLLSASGVGAAAPESLAAFASRLEEWGDRFPAARGATARTAGAALIDVVRAAAAEQPVVLAIDDAHWLDSETLTALTGLLRDLAAVPALVVLTAESQPPRDEIVTLRGRLGREVPGLAVTLEPLGPDALRALVQWAMPAYDAIEADRLARRLAADSAGLPLLAVELLHAVALGLDLHGIQRAWPEPERTLDHTMPGSLPDTVVAAIRIGYRKLTRDAQSVLAAASVLGDRVAPARLAAATGLAPDALAAALDEAEWQRWLLADGRGYGFVARIVRDVIARDMLTEGQRRRILAGA